MAALEELMTRAKERELPESDIKTIETNYNDPSFTAAGVGSESGPGDNKSPDPVDKDAIMKRAMERELSEEELTIVEDGINNKLENVDSSFSYKEIRALQRGEMSIHTLSTPRKNRAKEALTQNSGFYTARYLAAPFIAYDMMSSGESLGWEARIKELRNRGDGEDEKFKYDSILGANTTVLSAKIRVDSMNLLFGDEQVFNSWRQSEYRPQKSKDENATYYGLPSTFDKKTFINHKLIKEFIKSDEQKRVLTDGESFSGTLWNRLKDGNPSLVEKVNEGTFAGGLGHYTIGKGEDDKGKYISVYDLWDINSEAGTELSPFEVYDRIYYNPKTLKATE